MAFTPDGRLLLASQICQLRIYKNGALKKTPAIDLGPRICTNIERGLVGVGVDPGFADNQHIYLYHIYDRGNQACGTDPAVLEDQPVNRLSRFVLGNDDLIDPASEFVLLDNIPSVSGNHYAGELQARTGVRATDRLSSPRRSRWFDGVSRQHAVPDAGPVCPLMSVSRLVPALC
jgi:glucose/arabinose dehydrogenase